MGGSGVSGAGSRSADGRAVKCRKTRLTAREVACRGSDDRPKVSAVRISEGRAGSAAVASNDIVTPKH